MTQLIAHIKHIGTKHSYDNKSFVELLPCGATVFGIFDAHLECHSARFARRFLKEYLSHNLPKCRKMQCEKIERLLHKAFESCQLHMMVHKNAENFIRSGCSATVGIIINSSLWVANVGDSKCVIVDRESGKPKVLTELHTLATAAEKVRLIKKGGGWYDGDLVCNKVRMTRALGDLWQIGALAWQPDTNLRFFNIKALRQNGATVDTVKEVMIRKPPSFCISYVPHVHYEEDLSNTSFVLLYTSSILELMPENELIYDCVTGKVWSDTLINNRITQKKTNRKRFHVSNITALIFDVSSQDVRLEQPQEKLN